MGDEPDEAKHRLMRATRGLDMYRAMVGARDEQTRRSIEMYKQIAESQQRESERMQKILSMPTPAQVEAKARRATLEELRRLNDVMGSFASSAQTASEGAANEAYKVRRLMRATLVVSALTLLAAILVPLYLS